MKIKSERDFWAGMMFLLVGVAFAWGATAYNFGSSARPGPGYFPFGLGLLLALLGALELFKALTLESEGGDPIGAIAWKPLIVILAAVALFGVALPRVGLVITLPLMVMISSWASAEFSWKAAVGNAIVLVAMSWLIFIKGLSLIIPMWPAFLGAST